LNFKFTVPGEPIAKGRPRFARVGDFVRTYTPAETEAFEKIVKGCARQAWGPRSMLVEIPMTLIVESYIGIPKSYSKRQHADAVAGRILPMRRGRYDWDNLGKLISDALQGVVYVEDAAICSATVTKRFAAVPRTEVMLAWDEPAPTPRQVALEVEPAPF
jgi:Holliday junction resolvase RusA-like endonuclease